ncbi:HD domain-containing protein [Desulfogranum marinum]|uniref:HD domain-containing protein n=1 Tax=Desulfogranum marinum TaxID=453220 RepID=UPI00196422C2|nr:HD domain-containing protein [Desulfogranum marinum]MBM9511742.1 HD domain-containing protein [Desulfogranum marinum]
MSDPAESCFTRIRTISGHYCTLEGGSHGPDHSERVFRMAMVIGKKMQANLLILGTAALLHDIGRKAETESKGKICHAEHSAELARSELMLLDYKEDDIKHICHCIRSHRFRKGSPPQSMEAKILFDADKLDSIGAIGIGRAFLFAGQIGACLHNPEKDPEETEAYSKQDTAYREFQVKMSKVKDQMLTPIGRQIAERRHHFMELFFDELNGEIYGTADGTQQI